MEYLNIKGLTVKASNISFGTATSTLEDEEKNTRNAGLLCVERRKLH